MSSSNILRIASELSTMSTKKPSRQALERAVETMRVYLGTLDKTTVRSQQKLYDKITKQIRAISDLGFEFEDIWNQVEAEARKRGVIMGQPGKDF